MSLLREADLSGFLKKRTDGFNGLLIYGNDESAISAALREVASAWPAGEEPLRLDVAALRNDPAVLDDAFRALSLLGGRRLIIVTGVEETHFNWVNGVIESSALGNFVVLASGSLKKGGKLRDAAEGSQNFACLPIYDEGEQGLIGRLQLVARQRGIELEGGALERFVELVGFDRAIALREFEKLALYCHPALNISRADVEAACGNQAEYEADALISAVLDGDADRVDRVFAGIVESGDAKSVLILVQLHLQRLEQVSAARARGADQQAAFRAAKPPFFEKQQGAAGRHLKVFSGDELGKAQAAVQTAILQSRQWADLGEAITGRCLLSLARLARQLRSRAAV